MASRGGTNRPGGRSKPAKYSGSRVYGTLGGWTKALDWHNRGPAPDGEAPRAKKRHPRPPKGGQCQVPRKYGNGRESSVGICGLPENHHKHWYKREIFENQPSSWYGHTYYHAFMPETHEGGG